MIPDNFKVLTNEQGERLILPEKAVGNDQWINWDHRWLRSLHIDQNDRVISVGFPKFMNLGEGVGKYNVTIEELRAQPYLSTTTKEDGSLIVRYVHNNKVCYRTRGSFGVFLDDVDEFNKTLSMYPVLADPTFIPNSSLLFEWVSPTNQIVLKYPESALKLIGCIDYSKTKPWYETSFSITSHDDLSIIGNNAGVHFISYGEILGAEIDGFVERARRSRGIEGYVIYFNNGQQLVKVKTDQYFILHALKSNLTSSRLVDLWLSWGKPNYEKFQEFFCNAYDYECFQWAQAPISSMFDGIKEAMGIISHISSFVEANKYADRKSFAILAKQQISDPNKLPVCFMLYDNQPVPDKFWKMFILQNSKQYEMGMFNESKELY